MNEKMKKDGLYVSDRMLSFYNIEDTAKGFFLLRVDWLLENAVYPLENSYAENLMDLWNVYMPDYDFDEIVLEYSKKYFVVLRYVHEGKIHQYNSTKNLQECAIKNYIKYCISQGETNRMTLMHVCFNLLKDLSDRTKLYDIINQTIENYFSNGEIDQNSAIFLKRFQDYLVKPYIDILDRLRDIQEEKKQALNARQNLFSSLQTKEVDIEEFQTLINILLCRIAMADGEKKFSDVLKTTWKTTIPEIPYKEQIYSFIEKYEKPYMIAACFGIKNINDEKIIQQLYKDAVILCAVLEGIEKGSFHFWY